MMLKVRVWDKCQKHFETLKFMLDITEQGGNNAIIETGANPNNELRQEGGEGSSPEQGQ